MSDCEVSVYEGRSSGGAGGEVLVNGVPLDNAYHASCRPGTGFGWGYHGEGPHSAARSILENLYNQNEAKMLCGRFQKEVIERLGQEDDWKMTANEIRGWIECHREAIMAERFVEDVLCGRRKGSAEEGILMQQRVVSEDWRLCLPVAAQKAPQ